MGPLVSQPWSAPHLLKSANPTIRTAKMSAHWLQKMRTYFERIDFDKDGAITRADFEGMASRFAKDGALDAGKAADLMTTLTGVWDTYLKATLEGPLPLFFHAVDRNNDGQIDQKEYE